MSLVVNSITKTYSTDVIKDMSYTFAPGRLYVIKGVSGCGKTTLLNVLGGLDTDYKGTVTLHGESGKDVLNANVGYIFQQSLLISDLTVFENLLMLNGDADLIDSMLSRLKIVHLKNNLPAQLSGGERQRVAIARALITGVKVLLADEPTASLDENNSRSVADLLADLCNDGCTIIVATHEHYFDTLADEILFLDYGRIDHVDYVNDRPITASKQKIISGKKCSPRILNLVVARYKRRKKHNSVVSAIVLILLILIISTLSSNVQFLIEEYLSQYYPSDVVTIREEWLSKVIGFSEKELKIYYPYATTHENANVFYYLNKNASVLAADGMIKYGTFPDQKDEVIVSYEYCEAVCGYEFTEDDVIGREITINGKQYTVSACLQSFEDNPSLGIFTNFERVFDSDVFYKRQRGSMIFMDYDIIKEFGESFSENNGYVQVYYRNLMQDQEFIEKLHGLSTRKYNINTIESTVNEISETIKWFTLILYFVLVVCFIIACIFIRSRVDIDLFYRKREIGFLQIFKMPGKALCKMLIYEYLIGIAKAALIALIVYATISTGLATVCGRIMIFNLPHVGLMFVVLLIIYFFSLRSAINKFLRKDVVELIR